MGHIFGKSIFSNVTQGNGNLLLPIVEIPTASGRRAFLTRKSQTKATYSVKRRRFFISANERSEDVPFESGVEI